MEKEKLKNLLTEAMTAEAERATEIITEVVKENERIESELSAAITAEGEANSRYSDLKEKYIKRFMNPASDNVEDIEGEKPDTGKPDEKVSFESLFK